MQIFWSLTNGNSSCRKLKLDENVANIWPEFRGNGKEHIKVTIMCIKNLLSFDNYYLEFIIIHRVFPFQVHHILNHTSGLHNALADLRGENAFLMTEWDACLKLIEASKPETEPGKQQLYHYLSFGWLCGGIIEVFSHAHSLDYITIPQCI